MQGKQRKGAGLGAIEAAGGETMVAGYLGAPYTYASNVRINNPAERWTLPWTDTTQNPNITYNSNQIRKVNVHLGVRSEQMSKPTQDYVRNHINTSVDVRSMASVDRYKTASEVQ